jgi:hypothetical protein
VVLLLGREGNALKVLMTTRKVHVSARTPTTVKEGVVCAHTTLLGNMKVKVTDDAMHIGSYMLRQDDKKSLEIDLPFE